MKIALVMCLCIGLSSFADAQIQVGLAKEPSSPKLLRESVDPVSGVVGAYPICGSLLLHDKEQALLQYLSRHPGATLPGLKKTSAWGFTVGSAHAWYAYDYVSTNQYLTNSTCRGVGTHCYIFVEDSMWTTGRVNQIVVDSVMNAFDNSVPANPSKGVYQMDVDAFGNPPDVDSDPRIIILILNIRDGFDGSGGYIEGYFYGLNESEAATSSNAEIYFLDANPTNLATVSGRQSAMSTTAHEFQHMIHWNYNKLQSSFVNEGCSLVAEVNCGYPIYDQFWYANEPNHFLLDWRTNDLSHVLFDYSRAARFHTYLRDQFGMGIFASIVQSTPRIGLTSIEYGLQQVSSARQFSDVYLDWEIANTLDDRTVDPKYGYVYPGLPGSIADVRVNPNMTSTNEWIQPLAVKYVSFTAGENLSITTTTSSANIVSKVAEIGSPNSVTQLTSGAAFPIPGFGSTYHAVTLALMNTSTTDSQQVSVLASGTAPTSIAVAYENREPTGYLPLSSGDTVAVLFDGVAGGRLDSIRVALRRAKPITGVVWSFGATGHILGAPLCPAFIATGTSNPAFDNVAQHYPIPYPNWVTVDLRSSNIDVSNQFAVGFVYEGDSTVQQRLMVSPQPIANVHSYTYLKEGVPPGWFYLTSNSSADSVWAYLIRAYLSFPVAGVQGPKELLPSTVQLEQNFPNPFNPGTVLSFELRKAGAVRLTVVDMLGRQVAELLNGPMAVGRHTVRFDGSNLSSGVYFYRLETPGLVQVKKMTLLR